MVAAALVAALGTTLVFLYARGADARAEDRFATAPVLVVTEPVEAGERFADLVAAGKVEVAHIARGARLASALVSTSEAAESAVALTPLYPGEQVIGEKLGDAADTAPTLLIPDTGELAISVELSDPSRVAGFVTPGSEISIFITTSTYSRVLVDRVTVLGVGSTTPVSAADEAEQAAEQLPRTLLTLSVTQKQAERVLFGQSIGELAVGLLTDKSSIEPGSTTGPGNLFR